MYCGQFPLRCPVADPVTDLIAHSHSESALCTRSAPVADLYLRPAAEPVRTRCVSQISFAQKLRRIKLVVVGAFCRASETNRIQRDQWQNSYDWTLSVFNRSSRSHPIDRHRKRNAPPSSTRRGRRLRRI